MRFKLFTVAVALILVGCGTSDSDDDQCLTQYTSTTIQVSGSGLMLEPSTGMHVTFEQIKQFYQETEICMGVFATGPVVRFEDFDGPMEVTSVGIGLVRINTNPSWPRDCRTDEFGLRHGFVHYLLHVSGEPLEDNKAHTSIFFDQCT